MAQDQRIAFARSEVLLAYQYLLHDRDRIFSASLDASMKKFGLRLLKSPYQSPLANRICERLIGNRRRECLDFLIPLTQLHLLRLLKAWATYYNTVRPYLSLGLGSRVQPRRYRLPSDHTDIGCLKSGSSLIARCSAECITITGSCKPPPNCKNFLRTTPAPVPSRPAGSTQELGEKTPLAIPGQLHFRDSGDSVPGCRQSLDKVWHFKWFWMHHCGALRN